jgi:hypothetical protein
MLGTPETGTALAAPAVVTSAFYLAFDHYGLRELKGQTPLCAETNILLTGSERDGGSTSGTNGTPDQCSSSATGDAPNERARPGAAADQSEVTFLVRPASGVDVRSLQQYVLALHANRN